MIIEEQLRRSKGIKLEVEVRGGTTESPYDFWSNYLWNKHVYEVKY